MGADSNDLPTSFKPQVKKFISNDDFEINVYAPQTASSEQDNPLFMDFDLKAEQS